MLEKYSEWEDWHHVRFSDEIHFGWDPQGKLRIIRKPGERYCQNCIQEENKADEKDKKRHHCWAAIGHSFKSDIFFYNVSGNTNGKMSQKAYIEQILNPIILLWLQTGLRFFLEEDGDSGHGPGKSNIVRTWKEKNELNHYFNCASSPDLSPIENCWQPVKHYLRKYPYWDDANTKELIYEGWSHVSQRFFNEQVATMLKRLQAEIDKGRMTGYRGSK